MDLSEALKTGQNVQLGEALGQGLLVTGVGLAIVFSVLIILMIVLMLMKVFFYKDPAKQKQPEQTPETAMAAVSDDTPSQPSMDEGQLIAVLTAAVAASLNTSTYHLQIKAYRRVDNQMPAWNKAGVQETINSRF